MIKVILSALNEAQNLQKLLPNINFELQNLNCPYEIILCLDGGSDESYNLILELQKSFAIRVLKIQNQHGLGLAYKRLFLDVLKNSQDEDVIISLDADNTHDAKQIKDFLHHFNEHNLDLLIASRFCKNSTSTKFPLYRKFISKATSIVLQIFFPIKKISGKKLQDYSSGYRLYKLKKLHEIYDIYQENFITQPDFIYTCEILINLLKTNFRIDEMPLIYRYDQKIGKSKLKIIKNAKALMALIIGHFYKKAFTSKK